MLTSKLLLNDVGSSFNTLQICQRKKVDMQWFHFLPAVFVLWLGASDNLRMRFAAWLLSA